MSSELSEYIEESGSKYQKLRSWIKDVTVLLEKGDLSEDIKSVLCTNIIERNYISLSMDNDNRTAEEIYWDINNVKAIICRYLEQYIVKNNVEECINQPQYKRDLVYVLVGALSMMNDNLYTYRVSNYKFKHQEHQEHQ